MAGEKNVLEKEGKWLQNQNLEKWDAQSSKSDLVMQESIGDFVDQMHGTQ